MDESMTIEVKDMRVFAGHGVQAGESLAGNEFLVSVSVSFDPGGKINSLSGTVDYVKLTEIIREEMNGRKELLETLAQQIAASIRSTFGHARRITVHIRKLTAPITNFSGSVGVTYTSQ